MMDVAWHLEPFHPLSLHYPESKRLDPGDYFPDSLNNWVLNTVLALPVKCTGMSLEGRRGVGATIIPQAMVVAADTQALVGMRSDPGAVGRCESSSSFLIFEGTATLMANLAASGGLYPPFSSPALPMVFAST